MATNAPVDFDFSKFRTIDEYINYFMVLKNHYPHGTALRITSDHPEIWAEPVLVEDPVITGDAIEDEELTVSDGTWFGDPTITYQWYLDDGVEPVAITDETADAYTIVTGDIDSTIYCIVTATNRLGTATAQTASTDTIVAAE